MKMMTKELKVPEELRGAYNNLIRRISFEYCDNPHIEETILVYLKLGGKKLADHKLESLNKPFSKDFVLRKMQLRNEILSEESSSNENQVPVTDTPQLDLPDSDNDAKNVNNDAKDVNNGAD